MPTSFPTDALPTLDIAPFAADEGSIGAKRFVDALRRVVHEVGFFYIVGHGISTALQSDIQLVTRRFFELSELERLEIENVRSPQFRGYTRFGHERTNGLADLREQIDIGRELPDRPPAPGEPEWLRLRGPNLWPPALPELRPVVGQWMAGIEQLGHVVLRALALGLGQPIDVFESVVTPPEVLLKLIRYETPADADAEFGDLTARQGVGAHRDTGFLTFVHQDGVGGLQVERNGQLIDVPHVPGAFVVNIGEMLQLISQGYFKATVHRVVSPPPGTERISVAYFFNPKLEATLAPVQLPPALAAEAPGGASADPRNPILANYGDNSLKVRLRAHPDVAERHHADLLASGRWST